MQLHRILQGTTALAALLILSPTAFAEDETIGSGLVIHEDDGVSYVSGGIGSEQQEALKRVSSQFNLRVTMSTKDGKYIGKAGMRIVDAGGRTVIDAPSNGPLFFAKVPPGKYEVQATASGKSLSRNVTVGPNGHQQVVLTWPAADQGPGS